MAKQRMAGEREGVAEAMSQADRNRAARERRASDPEQLAALMGKVDRDKYDFEGFDDKQIAMAFQGGEFGDKDYARLTGNPINEPMDPAEPDVDQIVTTPGFPSPVTQPGSGIVDLVDAINSIDTLPSPGPAPGGSIVQNVNQVQDFSRAFGNNQNTIGDENISYGDFNQGNQDRSFSMGLQRVF